MPFVPFEIEVHREGPAYKRVQAADGTWTETVLDEAPVNIVEQGELEDEEYYLVENAGPGAAHLWPDAVKPVFRNRRGYFLPPRGLKALTVVQPDEQGPIWVWANEGLKAILKVAAAPS